MAQTRSPSLLLLLLLLLAALAIVLQPSNAKTYAAVTYHATALARSLAPPPVHITHSSRWLALALSLSLSLSLL